MQPPLSLRQLVRDRIFGSRCDWGIIHLDDPIRISAPWWIDGSLVSNAPSDMRRGLGVGVASHLVSATPKFRTGPSSCFPGGSFLPYPCLARIQLLTQSRVGSARNEGLRRRGLGDEVGRSATMARPLSRRGMVSRTNSLTDEQIIHTR